MALETSSIVPVVGSIDSKREDLLKSIAALPSYSSSLTSFTRKWKDLESHFSSIQKSIEERFRDVLDKDSPPTLKKPAAAFPSLAKVMEEHEEEAEPRPELKLLCSNMDGDGLQSYIVKNREEIQTIRRELVPALRSAMDPAALVLDSLHGFFLSREEKGDVVLSIRRTCVTLLECLHRLSPKIGPLERKRAELVALEWKGKMLDLTRDSPLVASGFLYLVAIFGLVDLFEVDYIFDLLALIARRKHTVKLCRSFGLEDKMPDFVNKLSSNGKQLDAIKFVIEFKLFQQCPPAALLKAYVKNSKKNAEEVRRKANNSLQSVNEAIAKELASLNNVIKIVEEYNLGSAYQCEGLRKRIEQLEKQKAVKKRSAGFSAAAGSNAQAQRQNQLKSNKRFRPSASNVTPPSPPHQQTMPRPVDRAPYASMSGSYSLPAAVPHIYDHVSPSYSGNPNLSSHAYSSESYRLPASVPLSSHVYSSESLLGSRYYDNYRAASYGGYPASGLSRYP